MIVTFCGHSSFCKTEEYEKKVLSFFEERIGDSAVDFYLGGYGNFDSFAYDCAKKYKATHPKASLIFVTPYFDISYQKNHLEAIKSKYDDIFYPEIEDKPRKFAITYRNRYMVEVADCVIAYVTHDWGGAYTTYRYAKGKGKEILNIASLED